MKAIHLPAHEVESVPRSGAHWKYYRLEPPYKKTDWFDDSVKEISIVCVSGVCNEWAHETYIFEADVTKDGAEITDLSELEGSFRGSIDHDRALRNMGYEPVYDLVEAAK
jgi:hypothetical protein